MEGTIVSFRRGRHVTYGNQLIIDFGLNKEKAEELIGKKVTWTSPGKNKKEIKGEIKALHGSKGRLRAMFERGLPGQSINTKIKIE